MVLSDAERRTRRLICGGACVLLSILSGCDSGAQGADPAGRVAPFPYATPEQVGLSSEKLDRLSAELAGWSAQGDLVGAEVLIIRQGRAVFHEVFGFRNREDRIPMERNSIFAVQSMTKPYTATAILMLVDDGRVSLDDPVRRFVPSVPDDDVRIRDLLSHTSGLDYGYAALPPPGTWYDSLRDFVGALRIEREAPVGRFEYADLNYFLLGRVVEEVTGEPVERFIEARILRPLGMEDSFTSFSPDVPWADRVPARYRFSEWAREVRPFRDSPLYESPVPWATPWWPYFPAANGLYTTPMDHAVFMSMWMNGGEWKGHRFIEPATVAEALRIHGPRGSFDGYGLGWEVRDTLRSVGGPSDFRHSGIDGTLGVAYPLEDALVLIFTQTANDVARTAALGRIARLELFDTPAAYAPYMVWAKHLDIGEQAWRPSDADRYVGYYLNDPPGEGPVRIVQISERDGGLRYREWEATRMIPLEYDLVPLGEGRFQPGRYRRAVLEAAALDAEIRFVREAGVTRGVEVRFPADTFRALAVDSAAADAARARERSRRGVDELLLGVLDTQGHAAARALSRRLHTERSDSIRFHPRLLDDLASRLGFEGRAEDALAVQEMLVDAYPDLHNAHERLARAYRHVGRLELAVASLRRAIELADAQGSSSAATYRERLARLQPYLADVSG